MQWANVLMANFRKEFIELKRYLPNTIAYLCTYYIIFLGVFLGIKFVGDPASVDSNIQHSIVSIVFWGFSMMIMNFMGYSIITEAMRGTLEQMYMSPVSVRKIMLTRIISQCILQFFIMVVLLFAAMLTSGQWLNLNPLSTIPLLILTLISMSGVSFMIAGLAIIVKQIQAFLQIFQFVLMALVFVPIKSTIFLMVAPFVQGVTMVREVMLLDLTLAQFSTVDYAILVTNAALYFILGIVIFSLCEKYAIKRGLLGQY